MVIDFLLNMMKTLMQSIIATRPAWSWSLPSSISDAIGYLRQFDTILPVTEIMTCCGLSATLFAVMNGWKYIIKVVDYIADVIP